MHDLRDYSSLYTNVYMSPLTVYYYNVYLIAILINFIDVKGPAIHMLLLYICYYYQYLTMMLLQLTVSFSFNLSSFVTMFLSCLVFIRAAS